MSDHDDFAFEPVPGIPAELPEGEVLLWQGSPEWRSFAVQAFHARKLALYFGILLAWLAATAWYDGRPAGEALVVLSSSALASLVCLALVTAVAWGYARTTIYSLTNRRLIIRHGLVFCEEGPEVDPVKGKVRLLLPVRNADERRGDTGG